MPIVFVRLYKMIFLNFFILGNIEHLVRGKEHFNTKLGKLEPKIRQFRIRHKQRRFAHEQQRVAI
jgi:hypothetical protein